MREYLLLLLTRSKLHTAVLLLAHTQPHPPAAVDVPDLFLLPCLAEQAKVAPSAPKASLHDYSWRLAALAASTKSALSRCCVHLLLQLLQAIPVTTGPAFSLCRSCHLRIPWLLQPLPRGMLPKIGSL
jgi:hypothetical protein